ncbi:MAG: protein kinase family protein [Bacteroidales bacterium]|nr:protein kinase family protein [Bacteroidales bacterium]
MSIGDIENAILAGCISDKSINKDCFEKTSMGELMLSAGNFAVVFKYRKNGVLYSFRCWYKESGYVENLCSRWNIISNVLKSFSVDYLSKYNYDRYGIVINTEKHPVLTTEWIAGDNLLKYVYNNSFSKNSLLRLSEHFLNICKDMYNKKIAHGDLQHGNILVEHTGKIHFIDYDSFYSPALDGYEDIVHGLPFYQHPARFRNKYSNEKLDYFSELIIYLGILVISEKPEFAKTYHLDSKDTESFLFTVKDFSDLKNSKIYNDIKSLNNESLNKLLSILDLYLQKKDINELEPFWTLIERQSPSKFHNIVEKSNTNRYCIHCGHKLTETEKNYCDQCDYYQY